MVNCSQHEKACDGLRCEDSEDEEDEPRVMKVAGQPLERVSHFEYLGGRMHENGSVESEIQRRIGIASGVFASLRTCLWRRKEISKEVKVKVFQGAVISTLLYGAETWNYMYYDLKKLHVFYMRCLRVVVGVTYRDRITNEEVLSRAGMPTMERLLRERRWRWIGHVVRMDEERMPRKVLFSKIAGGLAGTPAMRWSDLAKSDMRDLLPKRELLTVAKDRLEWRKSLGERAIRTHR